MGVILTIAAACIGIVALAAIGIVALARHLAFRPLVEDPPPASWLAEMEGGRE